MKLKKSMFNIREREKVAKLKKSIKCPACGKNVKQFNDLIKPYGIDPLLKNFQCPDCHTDWFQIINDYQIALEDKVRHVHKSVVV